MNRFCNGLKAKVKFESINAKKFSILFFSLLLSIWKKVFEDIKLNIVYNLEYDEYLSDNFIPQALTGIVMKCLNLNISRITNGCIEKHFATIKKSVGLNNMPVDYINN